MTTKSILPCREMWRGIGFDGMVRAMQLLLNESMKIECQEAVGVVP